MSPSEPPPPISINDIPHTEQSAIQSPPLPQPPILHPPHPLTTRYARQLLLPQLNGLAGQNRLSQSRVLIIGLGGLGCPAALYLAAAGVGTLGLVDGDVVEESNLHRQVLHTEERVGWRKVESARKGIEGVNGTCRVLCFGERVVGARDVLGILEGRTRSDGEVGGREVNGDGQGRSGGGSEWDLVLDCTDNPATRYAINDAAVLAGVPVVSGAAQRGEGMLMVLNFRWREEARNHTADVNGIGSNTSAGLFADAKLQDPKTSSETAQPKEGRGPCYRCIFPNPPDPSTVHSCSEIGVLGTAVGTIGVLMAQEAMKLLVKVRGITVLRPGDEAAKRGEMLIFNAFSPQGFKGMWRAVGLRGRRKKCVSCDEEAGEKKITRREIEEGRMDYEAFCGRVEDVRVLSLEKGERVTAKQFMDELVNRRSTSTKSNTMMIVDVREEVEIELGSRLEGTVNIPFSRISRDPEAAFEGAEWNKHNDTTEDGSEKQQKVYFLCHRGNDSQLAAKKLMELDEQRGRRREWIGDVEGGFIAMESMRD